MDVQAFLEEIRGDPEYAGQIVHVRQIPGRPADVDTSAEGLSPELRALLPRRADRIPGSRTCRGTRKTRFLRP